LRQHDFDVVHAQTIRVVPAAFALPEVPVVVDFGDSFAANISSRRQLVGPLVRRVYDMELARVSAYERSVAQRAAGGVVITQLDRDAIGDARLAVIPQCVDTQKFAYHEGPRDNATLIFAGNMGYQPNVDAVTWFASECWPVLRTQRPELRFQIVGARPAPAVLALGRLPGVEVTGPVDSMVPYLQRATIAVNPIRCGSGMQNKLLEAMSAGVPVVTTEFANRGVGAVAGRDTQVGSNAKQLTTAVLALLADPEQRLRQARSAHLWVEATYGWAGHARALVEQYRRAISSVSQAVLEKTWVGDAGVHASSSSSN
jgi:glycosyltransferase involved in cell wall biosynthesis